MLTRGRQCIALTAVLTFLASSLAFGEGMYLSGAGSKRCSYLNSRAKPGSRFQESPVTAAVFSWAQGFMSAMNMSAIAASKAGTSSYFDLSSISVEEQWAFIRILSPKPFKGDRRRSIGVNR
jgi:hypothetical protein